jgi:arsenate reductase
MELWLNPACSKCRVAVEELDAAGIAYTGRRYLDDPPDEATLREVVARLGLEPWDIARPKESKEEGVEVPKDEAHRDDWYAALAAHPRIIQRPIITAADGTTVVGRDEAALAKVIDAETT